ncbi:MAG: hypothetical protein IJT53_00580 [Prevotella sp.]|nr:hypothetical protein [Prevotella sp.]
MAQESQYRYDDATQLWRLTENAAGLGLDASTTDNDPWSLASGYNRGYAEFSFEHQGGKYHRVQEGGQRNGLRFTTERYQKISPILVGYGRFQFDMDHTKDRAWCDVMRPYNSNPFFSGSSIKGAYDTQNFDLTAAVSTIPIPLASSSMDRELTIGMRLDYKVGDLSRLRDPRSRSELLDYQIMPGVTYTFGNHTLGLDGHYKRRKEKIPGMTTVQTDPNLVYYLMTGMENVNGTVGGYSGYSREWVNHEFGAELNYGFHNKGLNSLTTIGISRGAEDAWGQYKYEPGKYTSYIYKASSHNLLRGGALLHQLDLDLNFTEGYADEYRQQLIQEREGDKGYTSYHYETQIEFKKRYQVKTKAIDLHYRCNWLDNASKDVSGSDGSSINAITGYAGIRGTMQEVKNRHLLPESELKYNYLDIQLEGGKAFFKNSLWIDLSGTYHKSQKAELNLADATTDYAQGVLLPDMRYYGADYWQCHGEVKYQFPLTIKKMSSLWYVKAYCDYLQTTRVNTGKCNKHFERYTIGFSFGMYY